MKKYGLIGKNLSHSFSQRYFSQKFEKEDIKVVYLNYELNDIKEIEQVLSDPEIAGLNVTIPYKEQVIPFLDELDPEASEVMAVNTIAFQAGRKIGYNTDIYGFRQMIKPFFESHHERAMILGTGGASKAVTYVLENLGVDIIYISRNSVGEDQFGYEDINEGMIAYNPIIVNTTPVGMYPNVNELIPLPYEFITERHLVIDLIYNPEETLFLQEARKKGATVLNGKTMLEQQAEKSWEIWNT